MLRKHVVLGMMTAVLSLAMAAGARAGTLMVSPTRIELTARNPIATLQVSNDGENSITVQLENLAWTQAEGSDVYTASNALIATPTVFDVAPHASQVLRIALRDKTAAATEQAFRVYAAEVPSAEQLKGSGLQMVLRIGVPVFVEPPAGEARLSAALGQRPDGTRTLRLRNSGDRFLHALKVEATAADGTPLPLSSTPGYVLAGGEREWPLDAAAATPAAKGPLHLSVTTDAGVEHVETPAAP